MADLFTYSIAGVGFLFVSLLESLAPFHPTLLPSLRHLSAALLSSLVLLDSLLSSFLSSSHDPLGPSLPLSTAAAAALFLLSSLSSLFLPLPSSLLDLLTLFAFFQELLLFRLARPDPDGIESRYLDLLLVPILVALLSTLAALARPRSPAPRLARAAALALHGTWLVQMAFSFFSSAIAHGCSLHRRSRANYTVRCKGHPEYHRARAIATLQFNCHLALLVVVAVGIYAVVVRRAGGGMGYRPLSKELQRMDHITHSNFTLVDDDEEEDGEEDKIVEVERSKLQEMVVVPIAAETANGFGGVH